MFVRQMRLSQENPRPNVPQIFPGVMDQRKCPLSVTICEPSYVVGANDRSGKASYQVSLGEEGV